MYDIIIPIISPLILYLIVYYLTNKKIIKKSFMFNFWNLLLLIFFIVSGIGGLILALFISYGIIIPYNNSLLYWHVEFGIGMIITTIIHLKNYWKNVLKLFES
ncbi:hypothetical protein [Methanobrevibacter sp. DSM 116169]|uniref:hypothetical protein n=1 Tax=Methanobrevibacter sp. DSM 116169 TaxID=3242727 RepID=UPI0038FD14F7